VDLASKEFSFEFNFRFPNFIVNGTTKFGSIGAVAERAGIPSLVQLNAHK
jgi:hypothetical protein